MSELLKEKQVENKPGLIYNLHYIIVQDMIREQFGILGLDLEAEVAKRGYTFKTGELSDFETDILSNMVGNAAGLISIIEEKISKK